MDDILGQGRYARLIRRQNWEFLQRINVTGVVVIIATTAERRLLLVEQYRIPVSARVIELPAGLAGDIVGHEDEALSIAATRELEEETGYTADTMEWLCEGPVSAGASDEVITLFRAAGLRRIGPGGGDDSEDIVVHEVPIDALIPWLQAQNRAGVLVDPKVYAALAWIPAS